MASSKATDQVKLVIKLLGLPTFLSIFLSAGGAMAEILEVKLNLTSVAGVGEEVGSVTLKDSEFGLLITPDLENLGDGGAHGFHVHENPSCASGRKEGKFVPGLAAGGHFDPEETGVHLGPYKDGHLGDLPPLIVNPDGTATIPVLAPRLTVAAIKNRSIMVHLKGDNFSDDPKPLGGGGARLACGVIPK